MTDMLGELNVLTGHVPGLSVFARNGQLARFSAFLQTAGHGLAGSRSLLIFLCHSFFCGVLYCGLLGQTDQGCETSERERSKHQSFHVSPLARDEPLSWDERQMNEGAG